MIQHRPLTVLSSLAVAAALIAGTGQSLAANGSPAPATNATHTRSVTAAPSAEGQVEALPRSQAYRYVARPGWGRTAHHETAYGSQRCKPAR